jgi:hypothetical protein
MTKREKIIEKMRRNPQGDWRIEDLQTLADFYGIEWTHDGGSHVVFRLVGWEHLTVPAHRPIKPFYVKRLLAYIEILAEVEE